MQTRPRKMLLALLVACAVTLVTSCATGSRVVLVTMTTEVDGTPTDLLRIGPGTKAPVYFWDGEQWILAHNNVTLPEGWLVIPPPPTDKEGGTGNE
ncbi:MAG TPA: hypothetical protein ENJ16_04660 [Planctomycetaceae bacterium]|nr:hypothetical protein [Planctomycetaceae bacterium]